MTIEQKYQTGIGTSNADSITLLGKDLASEILGKVSFGEYSALIPLLQRQVLCVDTTASTPSTLR